MTAARRHRVIAAFCAAIVALVAGGSVWCEPLCAPDATVPSCHATASALPGVAVPHDCSTHSLSAFTLEATTSWSARAAAPLVVVAPATMLSLAAGVLAVASAENTGPPRVASYQSIRVLRI